MSLRREKSCGDNSFIFSFLLPQTDEWHSRYLVWRNCRGGASFSNLLTAIVDLPRAALRRVAAFAGVRQAVNVVRAQEDALPEDESVKALPAVASVAKLAAPMALEAQLQQAMMQQFAAAADTPDAVADDLLSAAAAAAAAAAEGGNVWSTSLPFSAAVRQQRFLLMIALVLVALIVRTALSILVVVAKRRVQVCSPCILFELTSF